MIAYADFIMGFPEFSNGVLYPKTQIDFWIPQAYAQLNAYRLCGTLDLAAMLFVAHNVSLSAREAASASAGQVSAATSGPIASKSIGKVSVSYSSAGVIDGAGSWNDTIYGQRLYTMIRAFGAGPAYVRGPRRAFGPWPSYAFR